MIHSWNPADPSERVGAVDQMDVDRCASTAGAARRALRAWAVDGPRRVAALSGWATEIERDAPALADLVSREVGKPITEATAEVGRSIAILRYYAQHALDPIGMEYPTSPGARLQVRRRPRGVALAITPWNFPVAIPIWKLAPALASGNAGFLRPSTAAVAIAERLIRLADGHVPPGIVAMWPIDHRTTARVIAGRMVDVVSFTGSVPVGRSLAGATARVGLPLQAEMGGQNAAIVLDDANIPATAAIIARAAMAFAGQKCTATSRIVVAEPIAVQFTEALLSAVADLPLGDPLDERTVVGPLISAPSKEAFMHAIVRAKDGGAVLTPRRGPEGAGHYVPPSLVRVTSDRHPLMQDELFGPVAAVMPARDLDHAIDIANGTRYGLVGAVYGEDAARCTDVADRLEVGLVRVNEPTTGVDFHVPFGGERDSSLGMREQGPDARDFYTWTQTVTTRTPPRTEP